MAREYSSLGLKTRFKIPQSIQLSKLEANTFIMESKKDFISSTNECKTEMKDLREITISDLKPGQIDLHTIMYIKTVGQASYIG
jgi:hypothetical protein